jgi:oligoribonuclease NrnB/cAMP/cGMP phosphodiesterase (DHH superfamily)
LEDVGIGWNINTLDMNWVMSVLIFSHEQDVDGLFSAAILRIAFPQSEVVLTNYGLEKMTDVATKIRSKAQQGTGTVIIADVGVNEESYSPVVEALRDSKEKGWKNMWLDHHVWPDKPRQEIEKVCELVLYTEQDGIKKCAAELCFERFAPENRQAAQLAAIAHRTDFPDSDKFPIPPFTALIAYYLGFPELRERLLTVIMDNVTKGVLWEYQMQADVMQASKLIESSIERSKSGMISREFSYDGLADGVRVAIAKSDAFVSRSVLLGRIMDESPIHVAIAYTEDGKVSIRKKDVAPAKIDCSKIALEFREGGGHVGAAGGFLRIDPQTEGDGAAIQEITDALASYFSKAT